MPVRNALMSAGLLVLRIAIGCLMLVHGGQKLLGYSELVDKFPDPVGLGSQLSLVGALAAELGCSLLLIVGLATRLAALPLAFTMAVALFVVHANDPWAAKELAAVYLCVYLALVLTGPGEFSLDRLIWKDKRRASAAGNPPPS